MKTPSPPTAAITPAAWRQAGHTLTLPEDAGDAAGLELFYHRAGSGVPLVFLHGFPTASWDLRDLWDELVARYDVVAHDLIGLGFSAKPRRPLSVALQADAAEALYRHLGIEEALLFAHDLGDTVAQELLARQLEGRSAVRFRCCAFLNGGLFPEAHHPRLIQRLLASPVGPLLARLTPEWRFRASLTAVFGPDTPPSDDFLQGAWHLLVRDGGRAMLPRLLRYMEERRRFRERWTRPLLEGGIPLRLIDGALDPVSGRHLAERYREVVPGADVVMLDHVGHYPHVEDPGAVLGPLLEFLEGV
jgi:pimeloyl-ACP methyl ester carboxylesterase